jgi:hypothetical protein
MPRYNDIRYGGQLIYGASGCVKVGRVEITSPLSPKIASHDGISRHDD